MEQVGEACHLCGTTKKELLFQQDNWTVFRCLQCGLGVLEPRPNEEELNALYRNSYFVTRYDEGAALGSEAMRKRLSWEAHRIRFFRPFLKSGRILDVGSGRGYFLLACRESGYEVEGFDVSEDAAEYVRNTLKIPVTTGKPDNLPFENESFDVVTMWHSLEHTENPRASLDSAHRWLRPGGLLVVDVPNYLSTDASKYWDKWDGWSLPYHFYHFTPESLDKILAQHGFEVIRRKSYHSEWVRDQLRRIPVVSLFARLIAKIFTGTSYAVVARKSPSQKSKTMDDTRKFDEQYAACLEPLLGKDEFWFDRLVIDGINKIQSKRAAHPARGVDRLSLSAVRHERIGSLPNSIIC